jgi:dipeptidyl aminopeptidase/acylaminoacyl peptidase/imidazolonepropionase-like amidohydrolase
MIMLSIRAFAIAVSVQFIASPICIAQETVAIRAGRLIDVDRGRVLTNRLILIRGGRIEAIRDGSSRIPEGARVIDLSGSSVLPGLIDAHSHLIGDLQSADVLAPLKTTAAQDYASGVAHARTTLMAGFTTVRDVGTYRGFLDVALRDSIARGVVPGPRMLVAGAYVTIRGGGGEVTADTSVVIPAEFRRGVANGITEVRARVNDILDHGADWVKVIATGAVLIQGSEPGESEYSEAEIRAAVEEAGKRGKWVAAHAHGAEGIKNAVRAGVRSIEHGSLIDDEGIRLMRRRGTWLVADVFNGDYIAEEGKKQGWPADIMRKNDETTETQRDGFRRALRAGVHIAYGTDSGVYPHAMATAQLPYMVRYGMTPMQAVQSATIETARLLGMESQVGSLAAGKQADLIAVPGDLLLRLDSLARLGPGQYRVIDVPFVMKGGTVFKQQQAGRALTTDDYKRFRSLQAIEPSPDGKLAILGIGSVDTVADEYTSDLWILDPATGALRQLTSAEGSEYNALWSPDGSRVAFLASPDDRSQVYSVSRDGGEPALLFTFPGDIDEFAWFPDGKRIAFIATDPAAGDSGDEPQFHQYTRTYFKTNSGSFLDGRFSHLWVADLGTGTVRMISGGNFDHESPAVSPDGRWIAFVSNRTPDMDENRNSDVFLIAVDSGALIQVSREPGTADHPAWSPDGTTLAWLEQTRKNDYGGHAYLWTASIRNGEVGTPRNLTRGLDRSVTEGSYDEGGSPYPRWSSDGRTLYVAIEDKARVHAYAVDAAGGTARLLLGGDRLVEYLAPVAGGLLYGMTDPTHLSDVYLSDDHIASSRQLTHLNGDWFRDIRVLPSERFSFRSRDGELVEGFVVKPPDWSPNRRYPTILGIHGGPQWYYPVSYHPAFQIMAGRGYLTVYINPRGSTGYGERFMDLVGGRYGHADDQDFMSALDTVIARGWADSTQLFLYGNSYGGIATNWLVTQTHRFRAAASGSGVSDYTASFGVDDDHIEWIESMGGTPWQVPENYRRQSPMTYITQVTTPTIFLHGGQDWICPAAESERMYTALRLLGVEAKLVIFPDENHNFDARASSYPERSRMVLDWFDQHRKAEGN